MRRTVSLPSRCGLRPGWRRSTQRMCSAKNGSALELLERDEPRAQAVVDVVVVVGDLVGDVRELRLEARLAALEEAATDVAELARVLERAVLRVCPRASRT